MNMNMNMINWFILKLRPKHQGLQMTFFQKGEYHIVNLEDVKKNASNHEKKLLSFKTPIRGPNSTHLKVQTLSGENSALRSTSQQTKLLAKENASKTNFSSLIPFGFVGFT